MEGRFAGRRRRVRRKIGRVERRGDRFPAIRSSRSPPPEKPIFVAGASPGTGGSWSSRVGCSRRLFRPGVDLRRSTQVMRRLAASYFLVEAGGATGREKPRDSRSSERERDWLISDQRSCTRLEGEIRRFHVGEHVASCGALGGTTMTVFPSFRRNRVFPRRCRERPLDAQEIRKKPAPGEVRASES